jgi:hypothetical protein
MLPASVRGDPRGKVFSSRGRGWGAIPRRGIPRCHPCLRPFGDPACLVSHWHDAGMPPVWAACSAPAQTGPGVGPSVRAQAPNTHRRGAYDSWRVDTRPLDPGAGTGVPARGHPSAARSAQARARRLSSAGNGAWLGTSAGVRPRHAGAAGPGTGATASVQAPLATGGAVGHTEQQIQFSKKYIPYDF